MSGSVLYREVVKIGGRGRDVDIAIDDEVAFPLVEEGLRGWLSERGGWFTGGAVTVNAGRRMLCPEELGRLRRILEEEYGVKVARFWCDAEGLTQAIAEGAGAPVTLGAGQPTPPPVREPTPLPEAPLVIKGTCRSGTSVHHRGDIIVLGDVNPGAQLTATGDIVVLGSLLGVAHAGADGPDQARAVIVAHTLRPLQLRIGLHITLAPREKKRRSTPARPEIAYVSGRSIVVVPFTGKFQRTEGRDFG